MIRCRFAAWATALALAAAPATAHAALRLDAWHGHVSFGFGRVFADSLAPKGSLSVAGGVDYPLSPRLRLGPTVAFSLLGSSTATRGGVQAGLDYSLFDAALQLHWLPARGPVTRVSVGPGLASARAELQVAGGGAGFVDLAVSELQPELALDLTSLPRRMQVVGVGAEVGLRVVPVTQHVWTLLTARLTIHY
jgi:hypothetical protein